MENKNGKLLTVLLIITIILIVVMGAVLYIQKIEADRKKSELENNKSEIQEKIDSIDNTIKDKEDTVLNESNLKQFNNKFYEISDIAKEYSNFNDIKNYKDFNYDLDGDGEIDKLTLKHIINEEEEIYSAEREYDILEYNGEKFAEYHYGCAIYIVDLNENDKNIEVVIYDAGPSDDPNYTIYTKSGNRMIELKYIEGYPLKNDKQGTVLVENIYSRAINPEIYFEYYTIQNGKTEIKKIDVEKIKDIELRTSYLYFSEDYKNVNKIWSDDVLNGGSIEENLKILNIEQLKENITFKIKEFKIEENFGYDGYGYKIHVELSDGRKGYIFHIQMAG